MARQALEVTLSDPRSLCVHARQGVQGWGGQGLGGVTACSMHLHTYVGMWVCVCVQLCTAGKVSGPSARGPGGRARAGAPRAVSGRYSLWAWPAAEAFLAPACWMSTLSLS